MKQHVLQIFTITGRFSCDDPDSGDCQRAFTKEMAIGRRRLSSAVVGRRRRRHRCRRRVYHLGRRIDISSPAAATGVAVVTAAGVTLPPPLTNGYS